MGGWHARVASVATDGALAAGRPFLCLCKERNQRNTPRSSRPSRVAAGVRVAGGNFGTAHPCADPKRSTSMCSALRVYPPAPPLRMGPQEQKPKTHLRSILRRCAALASAFAFWAPVKARQADRVKPAGRRTRMCAVSGRGRCPFRKFPSRLRTLRAQRAGHAARGVLSFGYFSLHKQRKVTSAEGAPSLVNDTHHRASAQISPTNLTHPTSKTTRNTPTTGTPSPTGLKSPP